MEPGVGYEGGKGDPLSGQAGLSRGLEPRWTKPPGLHQPGAHGPGLGARLAGTGYSVGGAQSVPPSPAADHRCRTSTDGRVRKLLAGEAPRARGKMVARGGKIVSTYGLPTIWKKKPETSQNGTSGQRRPLSKDPAFCSRVAPTLRLSFAGVLAARRSLSSRGGVIDTPLMLAATYLPHWARRNATGFSR